MFEMKRKRGKTAMERDHLFDSGIPFCHSASVADSVRLCPGGVRLGSVRCFCRPLRRDFSADRPAAEWNLRCEESPAVRSISRGDPRFRLLSGSGGVAALLCSAPRGYDESSFPPAAKSRRKRTRRQRKCPQKTIALIRNRSHSAFNPIIKERCCRSGSISLTLR